MAALKVFVSSTCYDLGVVRSKLQEFFRALGYEPVMSEHSDVLYDPRLHTHTSCVEEVANCDVVVVLIGSRFGGRAVPEAMSRVDMAKLKSLSTSTLISGADDCAVSITQLEVLRAVELNQPVFVFVDERVMHDHLVYEKNKQKEILADITFPSIDRAESARYIFEFINFLRLRSSNNAVVSFSRIDDIEVHLRKQWSALFQRLLRESRTRSAEAERARQIQQQLDELKTAILSSIQAPEGREIARGVIRYRRLIDFTLGLRLEAHVLLDPALSWRSIMNRVDVIEAVRVAEGRWFGAAPIARTFLVRRDGSYLALRMPFGSLLELHDDVHTFAQLATKTKEAIVSGWVETSVHGRHLVQPSSGQLGAHLAHRARGAKIEYFDAIVPSQQLRVVEAGRVEQEAEGDGDEDDEDTPA